MHMKLPGYIQRFVFVVVLCTVALLPPFVGPAEARTAAIECLSVGWPSSRSDLQPDPSLVRGTLPNGLRYVLKENKEPRNRVAAYLDIQAGSLHETDEQRGYAHFLEHMLFNGTTNFKPGELVEYFQSIGMSFGGDINARTSFDDTVYHLILPDADRAQLEKGFAVLADYGRGALLLEREVERERGVILSERRARDSAEYRTYVAGSEFALRGTRMPERMPIGVEETLQKADRKLLKQYYDQWYRPENMILVVVGDFRSTEVEPLVQRIFGGLAAAATVPACPDFGSLQHQGVEAFYHYEEELGKSEVSIESLWNTSEKNDSRALQEEELRKHAAALIVRHRLQRLQERPDTPFSQAFYSAGEMFERIGYAVLSAEARTGKWREALRLLEHTLRQALIYGVSEAELDRVKKEIKANLEKSVLTAATRDSKNIANDIIRHLNQNRVFMSPQQELELYGPILAAMDVEAVNDALRASWANDSRLIALTGNTRLDDKTATAEILAAFRQAAQEHLDAAAGTAEISFPYLDKPEGAAPKEVIPFKEIAAERLVFANGVTVNLKRTEFKKNEVLVEIHSGSGRLGEPKPGLALLTEGVVNGSGTGTLSRTELDEVLAGSTVGAKFKVGESSFIWSGKAISKETELLFQLLHTLTVDPGLRPDIFDRVKRDLRQTYQGMERDVDGAMQFRILPFLAGDNPKFGMPPWSVVDKVGIEDIRRWLLPEMVGGPLEISIVGDVERDEVVRLTSTYFGGLPPRQGKGVEADRIDFPVGKMLTATVDSSIDKSILLIAWPTDDFWDIHRNRRLHMLASVLDDRLRKVIREKLGATYSPQVFSSASRVYPHYGMLMVQMVVQPGQEKKVGDEVLRIADDLRRGGVTEEELERAKAPMMTSLKDAVRSNGYWLSSVLTQSTAHPQQLTWPLSILSDFKAVTSADLAALADKYLVNDKAATAWVVPVPGTNGRQ
ncbi:insulinase family protein [Desulfoprunum benzoelyticum]|uniref:Zinc protease n=1 Tax=Desulfoprunum benzoelyticum TaxID=1506996 RepID=A0A840UP52_9BACT|nr:M16 family metallopeptidase [Desulfoprunum benzoelyticum]MBB5346333.1 zinc protease [Desulfoprunum benzoelyticum]MBM9528668.1 insulinase family protein [Desulfoprunum benzoelyticum]